MAPALEPMIGRYLRMEIDGVPHRLYFEEAGQGIPLVCLHTAGADSRQYRHLLADPEITRRFRLLAFDMPWHGKSTPPDGWELGEYRLTTAAYTAAIRAFCRAQEFRALIALEAADFQLPWYDTSWLHRPDVHGGEVCAALVSGLIAPQSPPARRHETLWMYMQGGPGVFKGDLYFYRVDGDLREKVKKIDTKVCPLYLLTGEYDFSCTPDDTLRTAQQIPGAN